MLQKKIEGIINIHWNDEEEILNSIKESKKIRKKIINDELLTEEDKIPVKRKKKFWLF